MGPSRTPAPPGLSSSACPRPTLAFSTRLSGPGGLFLSEEDFLFPLHIQMPREFSTRCEGLIKGFDLKYKVPYILYIKTNIPL